jgi:hypothetical protein
MAFGLRWTPLWGNLKFSPGNAKGYNMTKPTDDTPPADKVADFSEKLADKPVLPKRNRNGAIVTAAATGIGSAALLAALLYANRSRKPKKPESE